MKTYKLLRRNLELFLIDPDYKPSNRNSSSIVVLDKNSNYLITTFEKSKEFLDLIIIGEIIASTVLRNLYNYRDYGYMSHNQMSDISLDIEVKFEERLFGVNKDYIIYEDNIIKTLDKKDNFYFKPKYPSTISLPKPIIKSNSEFIDAMTKAYNLGKTNITSLVDLLTQEME